MTKLEILRANVLAESRKINSITADDTSGLEKAMDALYQYKAEHPEEFVEDDEEFDESEYDENGYDIEGYDREGYDEDGYDREGYDENGYDRDGVDREGYKYDDEGYAHYVGHKSWEERAWEDSGMTWADFI